MKAYFKSSARLLDKIGRLTLVSIIGIVESVILTVLHTFALVVWPLAIGVGAAIKFIEFPEDEER